MSFQIGTKPSDFLEFVFPPLTFEATHPFLVFSWLHSSILQKCSFIFPRYQSSITPLTEWLWCAQEWEGKRTKVRRDLNVWGMTLICTLNNNHRICMQDVSISASKVGEKTLQSINSLVYTVLNNWLGFFFSIYYGSVLYRESQIEYRHITPININMYTLKQCTHKGNQWTLTNILCYLLFVNIFVLCKRNSLGLILVIFIFQ